MSDGKAMDLDFAGLDEGRGLKSDPQTTRRVAAEAGAAEGFTSRTGPHQATRPPRRPQNIQMNLKVPEEFRDRFQAAFLEESNHDRSIRSAGEFLMKVFEDWERR